MQSGYPGLDMAQIIFGGAMILILIGFAYWGWQTSFRLKEVEQQLRDFRELEPEGFEEGDQAEEEPSAASGPEEKAAQRRDILERF